VSGSRPTQYGRSSGVDLASALASKGHFVFTVEQAKEHAPAGVPATQVPYLLKMLTDSGWLVRLRRGLYAGTGKLPGGVDVPPFVVATSLVEPSAIGLWSALAFHDLTDQPPLTVTAITPRKVVTPSMRTSSGDRSRHTWVVAGIECVFVTLRQPRYSLGLEEVWLDERFRVLMTDRERTVVDSLALPRHFGGVGEGLRVLEQHLPTLDVAKLVKYSAAWGSAAAAKRMGWALERASVDEDVLRPLLLIAERSPASSYSPLDPGRPLRGPRDARWKLTLNLAS